MSAIKLVTEIPGPRSRELREMAAGVVPSPLGPSGKVFIDRGQGAVVVDVDGNHLIDHIAGVGCLAVGHSHPRVVEAIRSQAGAFTHTDYTIVPYDSYAEVGSRISARCGGDRKVAFFNSGAEAVENAVKIARAVTGKPGVVCFEGGFHGRTYMAMSLTYREVPFKQGFGPFVPEVHRAPYPRFDDATLEDSVAEVDRLFDEHSIGAVVLEPILGEGGFVVPPDGFLKALSERCRARGAVLICDEIQSGYGRTGRFLASQHTEVSPDIVLLGKSIAAGLPLSAVVGDPELMDSPPANSLGGTYPGNPVALAAAGAVLDVFDEEGLLARATAVGERLSEGWAKLAADRPGMVSEVRGRGAMVGAEFAQPRVTERFLEEALARGVLLITTGREARVVRHLAPLVIADDELDETFEALGRAAKAAD